jgi:hypothetical protein
MNLTLKIYTYIQQCSEYAQRGGPAATCCYDQFRMGTDSNNKRISCPSGAWRNFHKPSARLLDRLCCLETLGSLPAVVPSLALHFEPASLYIAIGPLPSPRILAIAGPSQTILHAKPLMPLEL